MQYSTAHSPLPLLRVSGPKLGPFAGDAHAEIKFIEPLGSSDDLDSQVWEVEITGAVYALKMKVPARDLTQPLSSSQAYVDYYDPFNYECRAYGRLAQESRSDLAVPAHEYLLLTRQQKAEVTPLITGQEYEPGDEKALGILDGEKLWGRWEEHRGQPIRAIVKESVEDDDFEEAFKAGRISATTMWRDLEDLHSLGILVRDIHMGNYIGGRLVELSRAWTMYHPARDRIRRRSLARLRMLDTHDLLVMLQDWWIETLAVDELDIQESLVRCYAGESDYGTDPRGYNWLRWEEDGEAATLNVLNLFSKDTGVLE